MMKKLIFSIFLLLLLGLVACRQHSYVRPLLQEAEALMADRPDSSLILLESVRSPEKLLAGDYATWCLLVTEARDKNYVEHTSDSVIDVAVRYFGRRKDPLRKAKSYYLKGRVLSDLEVSEEAVEAYLEAKNWVRQTSSYDLEARICNHLGSLYWKSRHDTESLACYKDAYWAYEQVKDPAGMISALRNIGRSMLSLNRQDSALWYFQQALLLVEESGHTSLEDSVLSLIGTIYEEQGGYEDALQLYRKALDKTTNLSLLDSRYYNLGSVYWKMNRLDSALFYAQKVFVADDLYARCSTNRLLYQIYRQQGDEKKAFDCNERFLLLKDSIEHLYRPQELERVKALYNKEWLQSQHYQQIQRSQKRLWIATTISLLIFSLFVFVYSYLKRKLYLQRCVNQNIQELLDANKVQLSVNRKKLEEKQMQLVLAQNRLDEVWREKQCLQQDKDALINSLEEEREVNAENRRLLEEKKSILCSKITLLQQNEKLLNQQEKKKHFLSKDVNDYQEQIEELKKERLKTADELEALHTELETLQQEQEKRLQQVQKQLTESRLQCQMYERWQANLHLQNPFLSWVKTQQGFEKWNEQEWKDFEIHFENGYPQFVSNLKVHFNLTDREIRVCCLVKLGIKTVKIAEALGLSDDMVRKIKSGIRKQCFPADLELTLDKILKKWY